MTNVATLKANGKIAHPCGAVGVVVAAPSTSSSVDPYRVRFNDGFEATFAASQLTLLSEFKAGRLGHVTAQHDLFSRVILRAVIGSRAYGLDHEHSDVDRRGVFLPTADQHWSLTGVPDQIELDATQECYWELQKFMGLALKSNPNVLECLYSPLIESLTPLGQELIEMRTSFLSRLAYQTYNGYVLSQFKKMQADLRNHGQVKWKHVMHLLRLLLAGIGVLRDGDVPVRVTEHRDRLLSIRRGEVAWVDVEHWRLQLHATLDAAFESTSLPEQPDYDRANTFLLKARRAALQDTLP